MTLFCVTQLQLACVTQANRICEIYFVAGDSAGEEPLGPVQQAWDGDDHNQSRKVIQHSQFCIMSMMSWRILIKLHFLMMLKV